MLSEKESYTEPKIPKLTIREEELRAMQEKAEQILQSSPKPTKKISKKIPKKTEKKSEKNIPQDSENIAENN